MTATVGGDQRTSAPDRRHLPRGDLGRRQEDLASSALLSDEDESALRLKQLSLHYILLVAAVLMVSAVSPPGGQHRSRALIARCRPH